MKKAKIYCILNENGIPIYVGKTINLLNKRRIDHKKEYGKNISIFLLDEIENERKVWKFWECYWISQFKAWGFKLTNNNDGGGGPETHSEESKIKMRNRKHPGTSQKLKGRLRPDVSERFKNKKFSQETKDKIKISKIGHKCYKNPERGKKIKISNNKHYKENSNRNKKISDKLLGRSADWMKYRSKPIMQYDLNMNLIKEWPSITEAQNKTNIKGIGNMLSNLSKTAGKYIWKYKNNNNG